MRIDDILAALILSLAMMRRIAVKTAEASQHPSVAPEAFARWRSMALRAFDQVALASLLKVVLNQGWVMFALESGVGAPWFQLVGLMLTLVWLLALVWAWKIGTDARVLRHQLGIVLERERGAARS